MAKEPAQPKPSRMRFGIGEWYGELLAFMPPERRLELAKRQQLPTKERDPIDCPFKGGKCPKESGICSMRLYEEQEDGTIVPAVDEDDPVRDQLRALCPSRFHEEGGAFQWAGEVLLEDPSPILAHEVGFLESSRTTDSDGGDDVGRIDLVLVKNGLADPLRWCALEIQGVYFSGENMGLEFKEIIRAEGALTFPVRTRRPDYRSSGPKRLMPQLQIKVPSLRRWGKKMAVVVDRPFFNSMGEMKRAKHLSLGDVVWFIVRFEEDPGTGRAKLVRDDIFCTTLENAVEGLTGGDAVPLDEFENRIKEKIQRPD